MISKMCLPNLLINIMILVFGRKSELLLSGILHYFFKFHKASIALFIQDCKVLLNTSSFRKKARLFFLYSMAN